MVRLLSYVVLARWSHDACLYATRPCVKGGSVVAYVGRLAVSSWGWQPGNLARNMQLWPHDAGRCQWFIGASCGTVGEPHRAQPSFSVS